MNLVCVSFLWFYKFLISSYETHIFTNLSGCAKLFKSLLYKSSPKSLHFLMECIVLRCKVSFSISVYSLRYVSAFKPENIIRLNLIGFRTIVWTSTAHYDWTIGHFISCRRPLHASLGPHRIRFFTKPCREGWPCFHLRPRCSCRSFQRLAFPPVQWNDCVGENNRRMFYGMPQHKTPWQSFHRFFFAVWGSTIA